MTLQTHAYKKLTRQARADGKKGLPLGLVEFVMIITKHSAMVLCIFLFPVYIIHLAEILFRDIHKSE